MKTNKFSFTIGVTEGYFHNNETEVNMLQFTKEVNSKSTETESELGIYIPFVIVPTVTLYKPEWGCPKGGEKTFTLSAVRNPKFNSDVEQWKAACRSVVLKLKQSLKQSTVTGEFTEVEIEYWEGNR